MIYRQTMSKGRAPRVVEEWSDEYGYRRWDNDGQLVEERPFTDDELALFVPVKLAVEADQSALLKRGELRAIAAEAAAFLANPNPTEADVRRQVVLLTHVMARVIDVALRRNSAAP